MTSSQVSKSNWSPPSSGVFVLAFLLYCNPYHNSIPHPFLTDDVPSIVQHPDVLEPEGLWRLWTHDFHAGRMLDNNLYRPVTMLTLHLNAWVTNREPNPIVFRYINILLFAITAWLLGWWLSCHVSPIWAWFAAYAFVAHPVHGHLIHQIVGRADLMAVGGILAFLVLQQRALQRGSWSIRSGLGAFFAAIVALGSKETGVLIVPAILLHSYVSKEGFQTDINQSLILRLRNLVRRDRVPLGLLVMATAVYFTARFLVVGQTVYYAPGWNDLTGSPLRGLSYSERLPSALAIAWFYPKQGIWPLLTYIHFPIEIPGWRSMETYLGILSLLAASAAWFVLVCRRHWLVIPLTLALGQYLLLSNLAFPVGVYTANRLMMPTMIFAAALMALIFSHVVLWRPDYRLRAASTAAAVVVILAVWLVRECPNWQTIQRRAETDLERQPEHPVAVFQYAQALTRPDTSAEAIPFFEKAVRLRPNSIQGRFYLANALLHEEKFDRARLQNAALLRRVPDHLDGRVQRTSILIMRGLLDDAEEELAELIREAPTHRILMRNLAVLASKQGNRKVALDRYRSLLEMYPDDEQARRELQRINGR